MTGIFHSCICECGSETCRLQVQVPLRVIRYLSQMDTVYLVVDGCKKKNKLQIIEQYNGYALYRLEVQ
jgi:hypothetical protein